MEVLRIGTKHRRFLSAILLAIVPLMMPSRGTGQEQEEYGVKAAYLLNFTKFVEWPQSTGSGMFGICILGDDPFETTIDMLTRGKSASGRPIEVRRLKEAAEAKSCQMVFVSSTEGAKASKLVEAVRGTPVLTVGESEDFLRMGGIVALPMDGSHVNIVINAGAANKADLKISAKLLSLIKLYKND